MRSKLWLFVLICLGFSFILTGNVLGADSKLLRFAYTMPAKSPPANGWEWWGEELEKRTNGQYKVEYYPLQSLFKASMDVENIIKGTGDITNTSIRTKASRYPLLGVIMIPTISWPNDAQGCYDASVAIGKMIDEFPAIQEEVKDIKVLWSLMLTDYYLYTKKPVKIPSDLKGMNIGCGGTQAAFVKAQDGGAVAVIPPKSYMSLKTGVIDGMIMSYNAVEHYKIWEVTEYAFEMPMGRVALPVIMNLDSWNSAPKDVQKLMMELGDQCIKISAEGMYAGEKVGKDKWLEFGRTSTVPSDSEAAVWMKAFDPFEQQWLDGCSKKGLKDAPAVLKRWKEFAAAASKR